MRLPFRLFLAVLLLTLAEARLKGGQAPSALFDGYGDRNLGRYGGNHQPRGWRERRENSKTWSEIEHEDEEKELSFKLQVRASKAKRNKGGKKQHPWRSGYFGHRDQASSFARDGTETSSTERNSTTVTNTESPSPVPVSTGETGTPTRATLNSDILTFSPGEYSTESPSISASNETSQGASSQTLPTNESNIIPSETLSSSEGVNVSATPSSTDIKGNKATSNQPVNDSGDKTNAFDNRKRKKAKDDTRKKGSLSSTTAPSPTVSATLSPSRRVKGSLKGDKITNNTILAKQKPNKDKTTSSPTLFPMEGETTNPSRAPSSGRLKRVTKQNTDKESKGLAPNDKKPTKFVKGSAKASLGGGESTAPFTSPAQADKKNKKDKDNLAKKKAKDKDKKNKANKASSQAKLNSKGTATAVPKATGVIETSLENVTSEGYAIFEPASVPFGSFACELS